jgi:hypothetical protein
MPEDMARVEMVVRGGGEQVEADDAFAAALTALPAGFLERHVEPRKQVPVTLGEGFLLGAGKRLLSLEILHPHQLFLPELAKTSGGWGHVWGIVLARSLWRPCDQVNKKCGAGFPACTTASDE